MYSTYDRMRNIYKNLQAYQLRLRTVLSTIILILIYYMYRPILGGLSIYLWLAFGFLISFFILDKFLIYAWPKYAEQRKNELDAKIAMANLSSLMNKLINSVSKRNKGEQFKKAYELSGKSIKEFQHILGIAMKHEVKEVWVTAFCRQGFVVRATATIGSAYRCRPSEDARNWPIHINKLDCDEIRQYHNHPIFTNDTRPSLKDCKTNIWLRSILGVNNNMMKTFIIFWNQISEYRVIEYLDNGKIKLDYAFDIAEHHGLKATE